MRINSTSTALLVSAVAGLACVSVLAPSPVAPPGADRAPVVTQSRCIGYLKLHLLLASTGRTREFMRSGECRVRIESAVAAGAPEAAS